jgi:hypothetical protein
VTCKRELLNSTLRALLKRRGGATKTPTKSAAGVTPPILDAIVECKAAQPGGTVNAPRLEEPAKFRDAYKAQFAVLVGPALSVDSTFESGMQAHAVSVWTVDDVVNALQLGVGPLECRDLFAAGIGRGSPGLLARLPTTGTARHCRRSGFGV